MQRSSKAGMQWSLEEEARRRAPLPTSKLANKYKNDEIGEGRLACAEKWDKESQCREVAETLCRWLAAMPPVAMSAGGHLKYSYLASLKLDDCKDWPDSPTPDEVYDAIHWMHHHNDAGKLHAQSKTAPGLKKGHTYEMDKRLLDPKYRASLPANHPRKLMVENAPAFFAPVAKELDQPDIVLTGDDRERYFKWFVGAMGSFGLDLSGGTAEALEKKDVTISEFWAVLNAYGFLGFTRITGYPRKQVPKKGGVVLGAVKFGGFLYNVIESLQCDAAAKLAANPAHLARTVPLNTEYVGTTDFKLEKTDYDFMWKKGKATMEVWLERYDMRDEKAFETLFKWTDRPVDPAEYAFGTSVEPMSMGRE